MYTASPNLPGKPPRVADRKTFILKIACEGQATSEHIMLLYGLHVHYPLSCMPHGLKRHSNRAGCACAAHYPQNPLIWAS